MSLKQHVFTVSALAKLFIQLESLKDCVGVSLITVDLTGKLPKLTSTNVLSTKILDARKRQAIQAKIHFIKSKWKQLFIDRDDVNKVEIRFENGKCYVSAYYTPKEL